MKKLSLLCTLLVAGWLSSPSVQAKNTGGNSSGTFTSTDGTTGTYVETITTVGTTTTNTIAYTSTDLTETGTDTTVTTTNTDGSKTIVFTHLALGAVVPFISTITFPAVTTTTSITACAEIGLSLYGTGTFTAADGTLGTLVTFVTQIGGDTVTNTDLTNATLGLSHELVVKASNGKSATIATTTVDALGTAATVTLTLKGASSSHHH